MPSSIHELVSTLDVVGMPQGVELATMRTLMIQIDRRLLRDDTTVLEVTLLAPEGFGSKSFDHANLMPPTDRIFLTQQKVFWESNRPLPPMNRKLWMFDVLKVDRTDLRPTFLEICYAFHEGSFWVEVPDTHTDDEEIQRIRTVEMFAGGFGGWKASWNIISQFLHKPVDSLAVELNEDIAKNYAVTHHATYIPSNANLDDFSFAQGDWILQQDVTHPMMRKVLTKFCPDVVTISSPCPPWSTAARAPGLDSLEGMLLPKALGQLRWCRPTLVVIEQVAGFRHHDHFPLICKMLKLLGYTMLWHKIVDLAQQAQPSRSRWLGIATRTHAAVKICPFQMWPTTTTWGSCKLVLPREHLDQLYITDAVSEVAGNFRYVKNPSPNMSTHAADVIALRIYDHCDQLPTFMARYGSQHEFSSAYLEEYGYFGFFLRDSGPAVGCRFFSPAEVAVMHGVWESCCLPLDLKDAWLIAGNQIAIPHGLLMVANACRFLGIDLELREIFSYYHDAKLKTPDAQMHMIPGGYMIARADAQISEEFLEKVAELWGHRVFASTEFWSPLHGLCDSAPMPSISHPMATQVTDVPASSDEEVEEGGDAVGFLTAHVQFDDHHQTFWFAPHLRVGDIEWIWDYLFQPTFDVRLHRADTPHVTTQPPTCVLPVFAEGDLTMIRCDPDRYLLEQAHDLGLPSQIYDPFTAVGMYVKPHEIECLMDAPIATATLTQDVIVLTCAFALVDYVWFWDPTNDRLLVQVTSNDATAQTTVTNALFEALPTHTQQYLGHKCEYTGNPGELQFVPFRTKGVMPVKQFRRILAVQFAKMTLNALEQSCTSQADLPETTRPVQVYFESRLLWKGTLHADNQIGSISFLIQHCSSAVLQARRLRVHIANQSVSRDAILRNCEWSVLRQAVVLELSAELQGGGGKTNLRIVQQTALASTLLDRGYQLAWVTKTVDKLVAKFNLQRLQAVTSMPIGSQRTKAIEDLCAEASIDMPTISMPTTKTKQTGLPWSKGKKPKLDAMHIDVTAYTILPGFFSNSDDSDASQIGEMRPQTTGVCLMHQPQAQQWLQAEHTISPDELAILVPGRIQVPSSLESTALTFPCLNDAKEMVLLQGTMIQMGAKQIKHKQGSQTHLPSTGQLVSFTLYKEDWTEADWQKALDQPAVFIKDRLQMDDLEGAAQALWGKSLRANNVPASPVQATTIQMHGTVDGAKLPKLLQCSGFNRIFVVPKTQDGRLMDTYRAATGGMVYKVEGLPFGCTTSTLQQWLDAIPWDATPLKALGPNTWLLKAQVEVPLGIHLYNAAPVLIRKLPPRTMPNEKVLLGRPSKPTAKDPWTSGADPTKTDPWAGFRPTGAPTGSQQAPLRQIQGPIEAKFQAQEEKLNHLQTELTALSQKCDQRAQDVHQTLVHLDTSQKTHQQDVQQQLAQVRTELDTALAKNIQQHSNRMDEKFDELKQLLVKASKRRQPEDGDDEMQG
eukprot:Skav230344  [mRNA]  locus=scaffold920:489812:494370:- [translate_table: standard]